MISCSQLSTCLLCAASIVCIAGLSELDTATTITGRRGGQTQTSGRFFVAETSNRAGNDELEFEQNEEDLGLSLDVLKVGQSSESRAVQIQRLESALAALKREDTGLSAEDERIEEGDASKATESSDDTTRVDSNLRKDLDEVSKRAPTSVQELGASSEKKRGSFEKGMSRILEKGRENNKQPKRKREKSKSEKQKEEREQQKRSTDIKGRANNKQHQKGSEREKEERKTKGKENNTKRSTNTKGRANNKQHQKGSEREKEERKTKGRENNTKRATESTTPAPTIVPTAAPKKQAPIDYGAGARCANGPDPGLLSCPVNAGCHGSSSAPHILYKSNTTMFCEVQQMTAEGCDSKTPRCANTYCGQYCKKQWGGNLTCPDAVTAKGVMLTHQSYNYCAKWSSTGVLSGSMWCATQGKQVICTKAVATHANEQSQSSGVLVLKRSVCVGSACSVFKTGLCIDVGQKVFWHFLNEDMLSQDWHPSGSFFKQKSRFAVLAEGILQRYPDGLPEQHQCADGRHKGGFSGAGFLDAFISHNYIINF